MIDARLEILKLLPKNSVGLEIGVHKGEFSQRIIEVVNPSKLYLVDPWVVFEDDKYDQSWYGKTTPQQEMDKRYQTVKEHFQTNSNVTIIRKLSNEAADDIEDNSLDFVYIDGDHTYEGTCADFDAYYPKVKINGFICGDDYHKGSWWGNGVIKAVQHNLATKPLKMHKLIKNQYCCSKLK